MQCRCKSYLFTSSSQENPFTYGEKKRRSHFECDQGRASGLVFTEQRRTAAAESTSLCRRYCSQRPCWFAVRCIRSGRSRSPRLVRSDASVPVNNCQLCVDRWGTGDARFPANSMCRAGIFARKYKHGLPQHYEGMALRQWHE